MRLGALAFSALSSLLPATSLAGTPGSSGADFLTFGQGPRAIGMGESQTAIAEDAYAAYWNPAGLALVEHRQAAFSYNRSFEEVDLQYYSLAWPLKPGSTLNLNFTRLGMSDFDSFDAEGTRTGTVGAADQALGLAYGRTVWRDPGGRPLVDLGANLKGIEQDLGGVTARTFALDLGGMGHWRPGGGPGRSKGLWGGHEFRFGFAAQNLGPGLKFDRETSDLPTSYRFGLGWRTFPKRDTLTVSLDQVLSRDEPYYVAFGAEYLVWRILAFRAGWRTGQEIGLGFRSGVGFKLKVLEVDYAFAGFGDLGEMHRVGLTVRLGGPVETTPPEERTLEIILKRASRLMGEGRYYEAVLEYDKALEIDPGNTRALEGMKRANESMR